jgi:oxygen-independent coproporphyrinogen III oxidase
MFQQHLYTRNNISWYTEQVRSFSLYLHIPFCQQRCSYCDFNTYEGLDGMMPVYVDALCREIKMSAAGVEENLPIHTIYLGGGTPSLLRTVLLERILEATATCYEWLSGLELTLEANPGTVSLEYLQSIKRLGVNRLSFGMQSANPGELKLLGRKHRFGDVIDAVIWARKSGIDNINLDLIFGLPYQTIESWQNSLDLAINLQPTHFSLYALTLEGRTPMNLWVEKGRLTQPDPDLAAEMYEWASERLSNAGYVQYEISNWAFQKGPDENFMCAHNLQYWHNLPYLGIGAGAHGYANGFRTVNVRTPAEYIQRSMDGQAHIFPRTPTTARLDPIDIETEMAETMIMGLRLVREGITRARFYQRFNLKLEEIFTDEINSLISQGLLEWADGNGEVLRLTPNGRLLGNQAFMKFV